MEETTKTTPVTTPEAPLTSYVPPVQQAPSQPVKPKKKSSIGWLLFAVVLCSMCACTFFGFYAIFSSDSSGETGTLTYNYVSGNRSSSNKILVMRIDSTLLTEGEDATDAFSKLLMGDYVYGYSVKRQLKKAAADNDIKAILLYVNSPGGTVVGSKAIGDGVEYFRQVTGKPVVAYVQEMAASGGYWAASSADYIIAETGSLIGSIGVILGPFEYYDKLVSIDGISAQNGIYLTYITGGQYKDMGNPTRKFTEDEFNSLQEGINNEYQKFVSHVSQRRKISDQYIIEDIKALIYDPKQALELKLIDRIGTKEDAYLETATRAKIENDYQIVEIQSESNVFAGVFSAYMYSKADVKDKTCKLCGKYLYLYGSPLDY